MNERRGKRGRPSAQEMAARAALQQSLAPTPPTPTTPDASTGEDVGLNRRGMPARQRKKNRFYFDNDDMLAGEAYNKRGKTSPSKKIKTEPIETEEIPMTADLPAFDGQEVEIPTSDSPVASPSKSSKGSRVTKKSDPPKTLKTLSPVRNKAPESPTKGRLQKAGSESPVKSKSGYSRTKEPSPPKSPRHEFPRLTISKGSERSAPSSPAKGSKTPREDGKSKHDGSVGKVKVKKEPGIQLDAATLQEQRYMEKREKDRIAKEREREKKRERDLATLMSLKRAQRDGSPGGYTTGLLPHDFQEKEKQAIDKKTAQEISLRLRNLLKLPKAHKWVCYEWFYSNIDKVLFEGENDFQICLKESFPQLKARKLTRVEWCKIRRLMGKPRRCSQAFFDEEREELSRRRQKIRMIQQRKMTDFNYKELPDEIPLQLTIGAKVTARLRRPQDGLFTGTIEGVDTSNNTYRITFDRGGLGTHSIPDYEVLSNDPVETVSTSSFALKIPRRSFGFGTAAFKFQNPGLVGEDGLYRFPTSPFPEGGMLGGFPIRLLDMIVRLSKLLKAKREKILHLKELNVEAEKMRSYGKNFNTDYRLRYARCVLDLDSMNKEMAMYLEGIQTYCLEQIAPDHGANQMIVPEQVQEQCKQESALIVETYNSKQNRRSVQTSKALNLVSNLTSLLLQIKTLSSGERNLYELKSIKDTIKETKAMLEGRNLQLFQNRIEIPMNRIQAGLCIYTKPF